MSEQAYDNEPGARARSLRAEGQVLTMAGTFLLAIGAFAAVALIIASTEPFAPLLVGGGLCGAGWLICRYAASRFAAALALEAGDAAHSAGASEHSSFSGRK